MTTPDDTENVTPIGQRLGSERLFDEFRPPPELELPKPPKPPRLGKRAKQPPMPVPVSPPQAKRADRDWANIISYLLETVGIAAITVGCAMIAPWLAFIVGGLLFLVLGVALSRQVTK